MKLGAKIGFGFSALIVIACVLGGMAVIIMNSVKTTAVALKEEMVPEVAVANNVERMSLLTMYETRGYAYTEEKSFLDGARKGLAEVKQFLLDAKSHAEKYDMPVLKQNANQAEKYALEYESLLDQTVVKTDGMIKEKDASLVSADKYMKVCAVYLESMNVTLNTEIDQAFAVTAGAQSEVMTADKIKERIHKISLANEIVDIGNWIRLGTWQSIATRDPELFTATAKQFDQVNAKLDELKRSTKQEINLKQIEECRAAGNEYLGNMKAFLELWLAREDLNKKRSVAAQAVLDAAKQTALAGMDDVKNGTGSAAAALSTASIVMLIGLGIALVVGCLLAYFITIGITRPINRIIDGLSQAGEQVTAASTQVSSASQSLAQGASEQASGLEETSASLEEMTAMTKQNADNANQANSLMGETKKAVAASMQSMERMTQEIGRIQKSADETAKIIKTIDEIAFQTNLLALNAAVEAARAGEAGKGFAVVAEEVRNLARRSADAAKSTSELIEGSQKNAEAGVTVTAELAEKMKMTAENAEKVARLVSEISAASKEQAQGIEQVNLATGEMDKVVQQNAANAEESASASEELSSQAQELNSMVAQLGALVGSAGQANQADTHRRPARDFAASARPQHHSAAPARHALAAPRNAPKRPLAKQAKPEEIIPLDEEDFKDF